MLRWRFVQHDLELLLLFLNIQSPFEVVELQTQLIAKLESTFGHELNHRVFHKNSRPDSLKDVCDKLSNRAVHSNSLSTSFEIKDWTKLLAVLIDKAIDSQQRAPQLVVIISRFFINTSDFKNPQLEEYIVDIPVELKNKIQRVTIACGLDKLKNSYDKPRPDSINC